MFDFDTLVTKVIRREGGYVNDPNDRGGETKFGISKRANPDVNVAALDEAGAKQIYKSRYWDALKADQLPEAVRDLAFDTAVQHGVGTTKRWLTASDNDPVRLLDIRRAALTAQAQQPGQEKFAKGWAARLAEFENKQTPVAQAAAQAAAPVSRAYLEGKRIAEMQPVAKAAEPAATTRLQTDIWNLQVREETKPTLLESVNAAFSSSVDRRIIDAARSLTLINKHDPDFKVPEEMLKGVDYATANQRAKAGSQKELDQILADQVEDIERTKAVSTQGPWAGLALGLAAETLSVTNVATGFAAPARFAANAGRLQHFAKVAGINVAAGTGVEAALQTVEGRYDVANLGIQALAEITLSGVAAGLDIRTHGLQRAIVDRTSSELSLLDQATKNLGDGATAPQLQAEMTRLRTAEVKAPIEDAVADVPAHRKLMDSPDEADVPEAAAPKPSSDAGDYRTFGSLDEVDDAWGELVRREDPKLAQGEIAFAAGQDELTHVKAMTSGEISTFDQITDLPKGLTVTKAVKADEVLARQVPLLKKLVTEYLPGARVVFGKGVSRDTALGQALSYGDNHIIGLARPAGAEGSELRIASTTIHEAGHAVFNHWARRVPPELITKLNEEYLAFVNAAARGDPAARDARFNARVLNDEVGKPGKAMKTTAYNISRDEWFAENFVKHIQKRAMEGAFKAPSGVLDQIILGLKKAFAMFIEAKRSNVVNPAESVEEFANFVLAANAAQVEKRLSAIKAAPAAPKPTAAMPVVDDLLNDPVAQAIGVSRMPLSTAAERADAKMVLNLHKKAIEWEKANPLDEAWNKRADQLIDNSLLPAASTGLQLLKSKNPVARMIASELLEDASGVSGKRQSTAAISKYLHEQKFLGNTLNDVQEAYALWRKANGGGIVDDYYGGEVWARFNRTVAEEIENRRINGGPTSKDPYVKAAADSLQGAYDRIRVGQQSNKTLGWAALGDTSLGYMPHRISPNKWLKLGNAERDAVHQALVDQFITIEGWDVSFSDNLAARYLDRVQQRATGGHDSPIGGASVGSAEIIEDALLASGMSADEVRKQMQRFNRGAAQWTKGRINLDLNKAYETPNGSFKLLDIFDTDQVSLLRAQAGRASGEVALARHGVYGRPGLQAIRKAVAMGADGQRGTQAELEALDQVSAEFLSAPFGTAEPKWMERARVLNSVVRLGGVVFNQFAEFSNALVHVGLGRTLAGVASMGRLKAEIKALARGEAVDNPLIGSIEKLGGAEFGAQAYKIVMPFDSPDHAYPTYGQDTMTGLDRLLRGASYAQAKLSLWRTVHSVQQRAMAEQIVAKIGRYSADGQSDVALRQFGITKEVQDAIVRDGVARFENGNLVEFDVTKLKDPALREDLIQAVHRGVSQIIQGTFIGETGKWAHDGYLKMLTQFRTFSLTAMEKQWARQRNSRGTAQALGILIGSMFAVVPVYMARVYANSIGREDQEAYIEERMNLAAIARQTLNYVALSGLAGDFFDAAAALAPEDLGLKAATGGRSGQDTEFVGNLVAPALSLVDDGWKALQNLDDPEKIARMLPGSRIPYLLPAINALGD